MLLKLLTFPVTGPINGVLWIAETLLEQAEDELYSPEKIRAKLIELELRFDMGEFDEETFLAAEDELLARLSEARRRIAEKAV
ncbi:MAG: gas vesicle protein GvpG [Oscillochloris sp.]|nr:gas vesicle protein GvpG [Oscillochloris sp.]